MPRAAAAAAADAARDPLKHSQQIFPPKFLVSPISFPGRPVPASAREASNREAAASARAGSGRKPAGAALLAPEAQRRVRITKQFTQLRETLTDDELGTPALGSSTAGPGGGEPVSGTADLSLSPLSDESDNEPLFR